MKKHKVSIKTPSIIGTVAEPFPVPARALRGVDLVELRADKLEFTDPGYMLAQVRKAKRMYGKPVILTPRSTKEGGGLRDDSFRFRMIEAGAKEAGIVDVEINSSIASAVTRHCRKAGALSIGSFHDFKRNPGRKKLEAVLKKGRKLDFDVVKVAVVANDEDDIIELLGFLSDHRREMLAVIAMGKLGTVSRILFPLFGSVLTYGYFGKKAFAPGQIEAGRLGDMIRALKGGR
jgi:3-dehydroquinate dehydratase-1